MTKNSQIANDGQKSKNDTTDINDSSKDKDKDTIQTENNVIIASNHIATNSNTGGPSSYLKMKVPSQSQLDIILYPANPGQILAIKAGPGSGKTWTLMKRVAHLIEQGQVQPSEILILSMTNRAVESLRKTLSEFIGSTVAEEFEISTFHSFCANLVDQYSSIYFPHNSKKRLMDDLSWRNFSNIFSGKTIGINGKSLKGNLAPSSLEKILNEIKSGGIDVKHAASKYNVSIEYLGELISFLDKNGIMRYQDFLLDALAIIEESRNSNDLGLIPKLSNYKVVVVDEFQDMHYSLLSVIKKIVSYPLEESDIGDKIKGSNIPSNRDESTNARHTFSKHLTIAGDQHQCIYEFLGSNPDLSIYKEFPRWEVTELSISESFRLTPEILEASTQLASTALGQEAGTQFSSTRDTLYPPILYNYSTNFEEYEIIIQEITRLILVSGGLLRPGDITVLGRTNKDVDEFQAFAKAHGFKCNKFSSQSKWINSKVHTLLDVMNILNQGAGSDFNLLCIILLLDSKVGSRLRMSKLFNLFSNWRQSNVNEQYFDNAMEDFLLNEMKKWSQDASLASIANSKNTVMGIYKLQEHSDSFNAIHNFLRSIQSERAFLKSNCTPQYILSSLLRIVNGSGIKEYMNNPSFTKKHQVSSLQEQRSEHRQKLELHVLSFYQSLMYSYQQFQRTNSPDDSFLDFFLRTYNEEVPAYDEDSINISTIHTAKGLEFPVVFVLGSTIGIGRHSYWSSLLDTESAIDPQKGRLFYVACTRARDLLYVGSKNPEPNEQTKYFTCQFPNIKRLIPQLSKDLNRSNPAGQKIQKGCSLYKELTRKNVKAGQNWQFSRQLVSTTVFSKRSSSLIFTRFRSIRPRFLY